MVAYRLCALDVRFGLDVAGARTQFRGDAPSREPLDAARSPRVWWKPSEIDVINGKGRRAQP